MGMGIRGYELQNSAEEQHHRLFWLRRPETTWAWQCGEWMAGGIPNAATVGTVAKGGQSHKM